MRERNERENKINMWDTWGFGLLDFIGGFLEAIFVPPFVSDWQRSHMEGALMQKRKRAMVRCNASLNMLSRNIADTEQQLIKVRLALRRHEEAVDRERVNLSSTDNSEKKVTDTMMLAQSHGQLTRGRKSLNNLISIDSLLKEAYDCLVLKRSMIMSCDMDVMRELHLETITKGFEELMTQLYVSKDEIDDTLSKINPDKGSNVYINSEFLADM